MNDMNEHNTEIVNGLAAKLSIYKNFGAGESDKELVFEDDNLIVRTGKFLVLNQLYYTGMGDPLSYAKIGTGGAIDVGGNFLRVPTSDMTDLYTPIATVSIAKTDQNISVPSVTLLANVDNGVGNGQYINEAGFFSTSGQMFNIKVFPRILKDPSFSLNLQWVIRMS